MKSISLLKKMITFYFYLGIFGLLFVIIGFPILFSYKKQNIDLSKPFKLKFMDMNIDISDWSFSTFIIVIFIGAIILFQFLKAVYYFKKSLNDLANGNFFSQLVITNLKKIGKCFLVFAIGQWLYKIAIQIIIIQDLKLGIDNTLFLFTILGLFFLFLSDAFAKAKETKQENDLTI